MSCVQAEKPHAICIPYPAQGHISPMLKLAKLLNYKGFHITFVNTEFNHERLVKSRGPDSVKGLPDFRFETIPDGLPPSDLNVTQDIPALCDSVRTKCLVPFRNLITRLNDSEEMPKVTCIVSDAAMIFTLAVAEELDIPELVFFTVSACGFMGYVNYVELVKRGYVPFKDDSYFSNGYLDTVIDWIPGMKGIRLKDFPTFIQTTDPNAVMLNYNIEQTQNALKAKGVILNTFEDLEHDVLEGIRLKYKNVYTIGPLQLLSGQIPSGELSSIGSNLWKEEPTCLEWLDQRESNSVVYVNFGSITVMTSRQLSEFAWGLANSRHAFLWIIRPDLVSGEPTVLSEEFMEETKERGLLVNWCPQEQVLAHPAVAAFLTHNGWNSTLESITEGVPMLCWPFFAEQQTNCRYVCTDWAIGVEINTDVRRDEVKELVREMIEGVKGKEMRKKALEWKESASIATKPGGSSHDNFDKLIKALVKNNGFSSIVEDK